MARGAGLPVCFPPVSDVEYADGHDRGVVLVHHAVISDPYSVQAFGANEPPAADWHGDTREPVDRRDDARHLSAVFPL
jgi:hypothetical protein